VQRRAALLVALFAASILACATPRVAVPPDLQSDASALHLAASVEALAARSTNLGRAGAIEKRTETLGLTPRLRSEWIDWWSLQRNLILELPGQESGLVYLVAHYDKVDVTPLTLVSVFLNGLPEPLLTPLALSEGAIDNATGVALLLELAARLQERPLRHTWRVMFAGSEESGLRGARAHVARLSAEEKASIVVAINIDTVGVTFSENCVTRDVSDPDWADRALAAADRADEPLLQGTMPGGAATDVLAFRNSGFWVDFGRGLLFNMPGGLLPQRSWFTTAHRAPTLNLSACHPVDAGDFLAGAVLLPTGRLHGPRDDTSRVDLARLHSLLRVLLALVDELEPPGFETPGAMAP
jgi:hypothetical protein